MSCNSIENLDIYDHIRRGCILITVIRVIKFYGLFNTEEFAFHFLEQVSEIELNSIKVAAYETCDCREDSELDISKTNEFCRIL